LHLLDALAMHHLQVSLTLLGKLAPVFSLPCEVFLGFVLLKLGPECLTVRFQGLQLVETLLECRLVEVAVTLGIKFTVL
jgi:hypothetical protein